MSVGSLYGHGFDVGQRGRLEALGFSLRTQTSVYEGAQLCHFIDFATGPALELIEVLDSDDYESFVPAGMAPYCPGISLVVGDGSPAGLDDYERAFADLGPYRLRVPFPGASGSAAPGWHYLNFARPVVPGTFIWLTAFDQPKPPSPQHTEHANGVLGVIGLLFDLPHEGLIRLSHLASEPLAEGRTRIGSVNVTANAAVDPSGQFPLEAVVLRADSLDPVRRQGAVETEFAGRPALRIPTNPLAWDLVITT